MTKTNINNIYKKNDFEWQPKVWHKVLKSVVHMLGDKKFFVTIIVALSDAAHENKVGVKYILVAQGAY